ncbi:hypothetical protein EBZ39_08250 [bacterium]|nr:hypothetical protein [bacterium]
MFKVMKTSDIMTEGPTKVLLYAHHGFGKTYQCRYYQKRFGRGLILSGESGLKSIEDVAIDYLPFSSWDGKHDPDEGVYSFRGIVRMLHSPEFKEAGYKWIAIDSLTELSERLIDFLEKEHEGSKNGFAMWGDYSRLMVGALKWVRDLPIHVYVTCLAKEETDANDTTHYWPLVKGQAVSKQVPALFDHVFCGVRTTEKDDKGTPRVKRFIITDEIMGWHGKARDPQNRLLPMEPVTDVTELLARMAEREPTDDWSKLAKEGEVK